MNKLVTFVSLGPGEANLISLKGYKCLIEVDVIFAPSTIKNGQEESRAFNILKELEIDTTKIELYHLPMSKDRSKAVLAYQKIVNKIIQLLSLGKSIAVTAEGDSGFYSSSHYISDALLAENINSYKIPGIPAFISCGATANISVVEQSESMIVLADRLTNIELEDKIKNYDTVVIMKVSLCEEVIKEIIKSSTRTFHYFENVGLNNEFFTTDTSKIVSRPFPYFSLIIIKS